MFHRDVLAQATAAAHSEEGQGLVEYVLLISLVAIALIGAVMEFRSSVEGIYNAILHGI